MFIGDPNFGAVIRYGFIEMPKLLFSLAIFSNSVSMYIAKNCDDSSKFHPPHVHKFFFSEWFYCHMKNGHRTSYACFLDFGLYISIFYCFRLKFIEEIHCMWCIYKNITSTFSFNKRFFFWKRCDSVYPTLFEHTTYPFTRNRKGNLLCFIFYQK